MPINIVNTPTNSLIVVNNYLIFFGFVGVVFLILTLINVVRLLDSKLLHGDGSGVFFVTTLTGFIVSFVFFCNTFVLLNR